MAVLALTGLSWVLDSPAAARRNPADKPAQAPACGPENLLAGKKPIASQDIHGDVTLITDGAIGADGTAWDAPVVVTLDSGAGFVTYDLGELHPIAALYLQADANDSYKILGSSDGTPTSFKLLVELPNVVDRGHGLRTRTVEIPPTTVRYLRVGEANGDGFYSISELAAYCRKPSPLPPALRIVEAPAQVVDAPANLPVAARSKRDGGSILVLMAAAAALAWLAYRTVRR